jgi:hypothetical protein
VGDALFSNSEVTMTTLLMDIPLVIGVIVAAKVLTTTVLTGKAMQFLCRTLLVKRSRAGAFGGTTPMKVVSRRHPNVKTPPPPKFSLSSPSTSPIESIGLDGEVGPEVGFKSLRPKSLREMLEHPTMTRAEARLGIGCSIGVSPPVDLTSPFREKSTNGGGAAKGARREAHADSPGPAGLGSGPELLLLYDSTLATLSQVHRVKKPLVTVVVR